MGFPSDEGGFGLVDFLLGKIASWVGSPEVAGGVSGAGAESAAAESKEAAS